MATVVCDPEIGIWYRDVENRVFEVIALEDEDTIEVQYADGNISEFDRESWDLLSVNVVSDPGFDSGLGDDLPDEDDLVLGDTLKPISWDNVVGEFDA